MDSDAITISSLVNFLLQNIKNIDIDDSLKTEESIIPSVLFATYFLFCILPGRKYTSLTEIRQGTHPSNVFRFGIVMTTLATHHLKTTNKKLLEELPKAIYETINKYKEIVANITGENRENEELKLFLSDEGALYIKEISFNWNYLRPKIQPFAMKKLAPYTMDYLKKDLNFDSFLTRINEFKLSYITLLYSNSLLMDHFKNEEDCLAKNGNIEIRGSGPVDYKLQFSSSSIKEQITNYSLFRKEDFNVTCNEVWRLNAHYLRSKVLHEIYELIKFYFEDTKYLTEFHSYDWFKVLYILGNNSPFSSYYKTIDFPTSPGLIYPYPNSIHWNGIYISNGQLSRDIRYSDKQVIDLTQNSQ